MKKTILLTMMLISITVFSNPALLLKEIDSKTAGFTHISFSNLSTEKLNSRIYSLLLHPDFFNNQDFKNGLYHTNAEDNTLIITEKFSSNIIDTIKIGSSANEIKQILGTDFESVNDNNQTYLYYKSKDISVLFYLNNQHILDCQHFFVQLLFGYICKTIFYWSHVFQSTVNTFIIVP